MVKTKLLVIGLGISSVIIVIAILYCKEVIAADWKSVGGDDDFSYFYDSATISYPSKGVARIWTKTIYKEKGRAKAMKRFAGDKELLNMIKIIDYTVSLLEVNCPNKQFRTIAGTSYSKHGKILKMVESTSRPWQPIPPDTMFELYHDLVCK